MMKHLVTIIAAMAFCLSASAQVEKKGTNGLYMAEYLVHTSAFNEIFCGTQKLNQPNWPFGLAALFHQKIQFSNVFQSAGNYFNLVLVRFSDRNVPNEVNSVYLFKSDASGNVDKEFFPFYDSYVSAPSVVRLIYHDIGKDNEFCGALVSQDLMNRDGNIDGYMQYEVKLPDDIANVLIDLLATDGKSRWIKRCDLGFQKTTSAKTISPYVID